MLPGVHVVDGEVGLGASEGQKVAGAHAVVNVHQDVGVLILVHLHDSAGSNGVQVAGGDGDVSVGGGHGPGVALEEGSDSLGIVDSVSSPVVTAGVVGSGGEADVADQSGLPAEDHFLHGVGGGKATEDVVLDEPVEAAKDGVDLQRAVELPLDHGGTNVGLLVNMRVGHVVIVQLLGVVGVANAVVAVVVIGDVTNLPRIERRGVLCSRERRVVELRVVEVLGRLADAGNAPVSHGETLLSAFGGRSGGEVVFVHVGRVEGDIGSSPLVVGDECGRAVLDQSECWVFIHSRRARVLVEVVKKCRVEAGTEER